jgi:phosphoribosyl 1,2-cyclic phosphodiesterase
MRLISLQSGSSGNCIYVESEGVRLLFDAGLSAAQVKERLGSFGRSAQGADALFISHDHYDHVRCAGVYHRSFGVPLYLTPDTLRASRRALMPGRGLDIQHFEAGASIKIKHLTIETVATPHDAADGVVFVIDDGRHRLGICTDVGHVFGDLKSLVKNVDGLFLESNYDERMLENGPYPARLKERISGRGGHISNREAAELVAGNARADLQWLYLAHLSDKNNTPDKALSAHREALGTAIPIHLTSRERATSMMSFDETKPGCSVTRQLAFDI